MPVLFWFRKDDRIFEGSGWDNKTVGKTTDARV